MEIERIINNNVIASRDNQGNEIIVMGLGIGFQQKKGNIIDPLLIQKKFILSNENRNKFKQLIENIPYQNIVLAEEIIHYAKIQLPNELNQNIHITLTDHINFAIERIKNGYLFTNELLWEIKRFYPEEFDIASHAIEIIKKHTGYQLSEDEAGFIALHFVNAEVDGNIEQMVPITETIKGIISIVQYKLGIELDENKLTYGRFIMHLKFLFQRIKMNEEKEKGAYCLIETVKQKMPNEYSCALKIQDFIETKMNYKISYAEVVYLTMHIDRIERHHTPT